MTICPGDSNGANQGYVNFCVAIVKQLASDYRCAIKVYRNRSERYWMARAKYRRNPCPKNEKALKNATEKRNDAKRWLDYLESIMKSEWISLLSFGLNMKILNKLQNE